MQVETPFCESSCSAVAAERQKKRAFMIYDVCSKKKKHFLSKSLVLSDKAESSLLCLDFDFFLRYEVLDPKRTPLTLPVLVV